MWVLKNKYGSFQLTPPFCFAASVQGETACSRYGATDFCSGRRTYCCYGRCCGYLEQYSTLKSCGAFATCRDYRSTRCCRRNKYNSFCCANDARSYTSCSGGFRNTVSYCWDRSKTRYVKEHDWFKCTSWVEIIFSLSTKKVVVQVLNRTWT